MTFLKIHFMAGTFIGLYFLINNIRSKGIKGLYKKDWFFCLVVCPLAGYLVLGMLLFFVCEEIYLSWKK